MSWEILALTTAVLYGMQNLVIRQIMKVKGSNSMAYVWAFNAISAVAFLLLFVRDFSVPVAPFPWLIVLLSSFLWVAGGIVTFESYKHTEVSLREPLSKTSLLLVFVLSVAVLNEAVTLPKIIGTLLILSGVIMLTWERGFLGKLSHKGVQLTIASILPISLVTIVDKIGVQYFSPSVYGFLVFLFPSIITAPFAAKGFHHVEALMKKKLLVAVSVMLGVAGYFIFLTAYTLTEVSNVIPVVQLSVIISVAGGCLFHKEKELKKRLIGAIIMLAGSVLILMPGLF